MQTVKKQTYKQTKKPFETQEKHAVPAGPLSSLLLFDLLLLGYTNLAPPPPPNKKTHTKNSGNPRYVS